MNGFNEKNKLKVRQICFIFLALTPVTKLSLLPAVLAGFAEEKLWLSALINFALDITVLAIILFLSRRHGNVPIYTVLKENLGEGFAKVIFFAYAVYFLFKGLLPMLEQQDYVENTLYEVMPNVIVFYPFFLVSFYACLKGLKIIGRCADVAIWFTGLGIALVIYLSLPSGDYSNLLPIFGNKFSYKPIIASFKTSLWYADSVYMLIFAGHFETEKRQNLKILSSYGAGALVITLILVVFYAVFGPIASTQYLAVPNMTVFSVTVANVGRFDFIAIFLLLVSQVFAIILPTFLATKCLERVFNLKSAVIPALVVNGLLLCILIFFSNKLFAVLEFFEKYFIWFFVAFGYVLPIFSLLIPRRKNEKIAR